MSGSASPQITEQVFAHVPTDEALPVRDIHERLDCWSRITVRAALRNLIQEGRVIATGPDCTRKYRRAVQQ